MFAVNNYTVATMYICIVYISLLEQLENIHLRGMYILNETIMLIEKENIL